MSFDARPPARVVQEKEMENEDLLEMSVAQFIEATAAKTPTPGGGSVAGVVGALGSALARMALNFTRGKKKYAEHEAFHAHLSERLCRARQMFDQLVGDDIQAYKLYREAAAMEDGPQKQEAMELALAAAIDVPREATKLALAVMDDLASLADKCNPHLLSDLTAGAALSAAVVKLSDYNVCINTPQLADRRTARDIEEASKTDLQRAQRCLQDIETATRNRKRN